MNHIRQYVGQLSSASFPKEADFETAAQLLALDWVKTWHDDPNVSTLLQCVMPGLRASDRVIELVAECRDGRRFTVGSLNEPVDGVLCEDNRRDALVYPLFLDSMGFDVTEELADAYLCRPRQNCWGLDTVFTIPKSSILADVRALAFALGAVE